MSKLNAVGSNLWSRFKGADHIFIMRYCFAIVLAWYLSAFFELDKPYWAMMTVSIVSIPSPGSSIIKLIARLIGTIIGVAAITPIVYFSQYDPWLMSCLIALWVSFCHYISCCYYGSVSYCFALTGYTSMIVGFATVTNPSSYTLFSISQARFSEILLGLFIVFIVSFIFQSDKDKKVLIQSEQQLQKTLVTILKDYVINSSSSHMIMKSVTGFILQMMNIKVLATQYIFSSANTSEKGVQAITNIYHNFNILGSLIMLKIMKNEIIAKEPNISKTLNDHEEKIEKWLDNQEAKKPEPISSNDIYIQNFYEEFDRTTALVVKPDAPIIEKENESLFFIRGYHDQKEAIYNGLRTFVTIMCAVFFWLHGNWQYGYIGIVFLAVVCCYFSMIPMIRIAIFFAALGLVVGIIISYFLKFGIFIGTSEFIIAVCAFLAVVIILGYVQIIFSPIWALFSFTTIQVIIFSVNFQNPMNYDFSLFLNISIMLLFGIIVIIGVLYLLPPSPEKFIISRMKRAIDKKFSQYLHEKVKFIQFKNYLATVINESKFVMNPELKSELITACFTRFLITYLLDNYNYRILDHSELVTALERKDYKQALDYIEQLSNQQDLNDESKVFWWKFSCILKNSF